MKHPDPKPAGTWDFYGGCAPTRNPNGTFRQGCGDSFTLGCFQWAPLARGKGTKRGKVAYRVKGLASDPQPAFDAAEAWCAKKNQQEAAE